MKKKQRKRKLGTVGVHFSSLVMSVTFYTSDYTMIRGRVTNLVEKGKSGKKWQICVEGGDSGSTECGWDKKEITKGKEQKPNK